MKLVRKYDTTTLMFLADEIYVTEYSPVMVDDDGVTSGGLELDLLDGYTFVQVQPGLTAPKWGGSGWVEGSSEGELLEAGKVTKVNELSVDYKLGTQADIEVSGNMFTTTKARLETLSNVLVTSDGALDASFYWLDSSKVKVPMDIAELKTLANSIYNRNQVLFAKHELLKEEVDSAVDQSELDGIVW
jgi:hypothetical protein